MMVSPRNLLGDKLKGAVSGEVIVDEKVLLGFSRDQSMYEIQPAAAVIPKDIEDLQKLVRIASGEGIPLTMRGGGSGTAGSALGPGIIVALPDKGFWGEMWGFSSVSGKAQVSVRSGVLHNDLQGFLRERGFFLPADVTSADISRIGGNIATRASGPHSLKYGAIDRFLERIEFVTAEGELVDTADEKSIPERFRTALADLAMRIRSDEEARSVLAARQGLKSSSGYDLSAFLGDVRPARLIVKLLTGSVGTLGLVAGATLRGEVYEKERAAALLFFEDLTEAVRAVPILREAGVASIELISRETLQVVREHTSFASGIDREGHVLMVEATGRDSLDTLESVAALLARSGFRMKGSPHITASDHELEDRWRLRRNLLWLIEHPKPGLRALPVVNDVGVPLPALAEFVRDAERIFARHKVLSFVYGHAGEGNLHLRPLFDLSLPDLSGRVRRLADDIYEAVLSRGGTITSEHGMGRVRAPYLKREWGERLYGCMQEVKRIFDPKGLLNPGVMFTDAPITDHIRPDLLKP